MERILLILLPFLMLYGCAFDIQSIKDEIRIPFVSDQGSRQEKAGLTGHKDGHTQSSQLATDE